MKEDCKWPIIFRPKCTSYLLSIVPTDLARSYVIILLKTDMNIVYYVLLRSTRPRYQISFPDFNKFEYLKLHKLYIMLIIGNSYQKSLNVARSIWSKYTRKLKSLFTFKIFYYIIIRFVGRNDQSTYKRE